MTFAEKRLAAPKMASAGACSATVTSASCPCFARLRPAAAAVRSKALETAICTYAGGPPIQFGGEATSPRTWLPRGQGNAHAVDKAACAAGDPSVAIKTRKPPRLRDERRIASASK